MVFPIPSVTYVYERRGATPKKPFLIHVPFGHEGNVWSGVAHLPSWVLWDEAPGDLAFRKDQTFLKSAAAAKALWLLR